MKFTSYWLDTSQPFDDESSKPLEGHYDVAVVGGGLTGSSAALALARKGAWVAVLEMITSALADRDSPNSTPISSGAAATPLTSTRPPNQGRRTRPHPRKRDSASAESPKTQQPEGKYLTGSLGTSTVRKYTVDGSV
jgi:choline dehydrogenase-like flavoprotein